MSAMIDRNSIVKNAVFSERNAKSLHENYLTVTEKF